ncbi:MAG: ADOP family duplicated permease [Rhodanobacteraceae bacterium]
MLSKIGLSKIWLAEIWRAWRASLRRPGFLLLASGVLALGIGASVAVFALIQNTLWRPLPLPQASRVAVISRLNNGKQSAGGISPHEYQYLGKLNGVTALGLVHFGLKANLAGVGVPTQVPAIYMDRGVLPALGLRPVLGRNFSAAEDAPNGPKVAIIGYGLWQRGYGGDVHVIGRSVQIRGVAHTIVGVLPKAFNTVLGPGDVVLPMAIPAHSRNYSHTGTLAIARLAPGVSVAAVSAQADAHERTMYRDMGMRGNWKKPLFGAEGVAAAFQQEAQPVLLLFLACAGLVLLVALVNLVNLMLLRALARNHDTAVRSALGAPWLRLMLPALGEGLLVGVGGALLGMALATVGLALLQGFIPSAWLWGGQLHVGVMAWLLAFVVGLLSALLAAVFALWRGRSTSAVGDLREGGRSGMGVRSGRFSRALVVVQVALATLVLCAAGVFAHALYAASQQPLGYADNNVLTFELAPVQADYPDTASVLNLSHRLVRRLHAIPGVATAAVTTSLPTSDDMYGSYNNGMYLPDDTHFVAQLDGIGPGFFKLFGMPVHAGRNFTRGDVRGGTPVAIVSQDLADKYYGGKALGQTVRIGMDNHPDVLARIVGVVGGTWQRGPLHPRQPVVYLPLAQMPEPTMAIFRKFEALRFAVRGHGNPDDWRKGVRKAVAEIAPNQPIAKLRSMRSIVEKTTADARLNLRLIGVFAALALMLAAAGLYAVMAVAVAAREREFGVRMALGAAPARLLRLVLRGGLGQIVLGLVIGIVGAIAASHALAVWLMALLGRSHAFDPVVALSACVVLASAGLLACLLPALRAARVQPMQALRGE